MSRGAALLLGALLMRPRSGVLGWSPFGNQSSLYGSAARHAAIQQARARGGTVVHLGPGGGGGSHQVNVQMQPQQQPQYGYGNQGVQTNPQNPYGYPTYDPTQLDPGYAQQLYGGVAYPGQAYYGGVPVAYGGFSNYGPTYGGSYGGFGYDDGDDALAQAVEAYSSWMDQ